MGVSALLFHHLPLEGFWNGQTVDSKPSACLDTIRKKRKEKHREKHKLSFLCWLRNQHDCRMDHLSLFRRQELIRASVKSYRRMREKLFEKRLIKKQGVLPPSVLQTALPDPSCYRFGKKAWIDAKRVGPNGLPKKKKNLRHTTKLAVVYCTRVAHFFGREIIPLLGHTSQQDVLLPTPWTSVPVVKLTCFFFSCNAFPSAH